MKANMGMVDRAIRLGIATTIGILWFTKVITGTTAIILVILGIVFLMTSLISFCPLYYPFKLSTKK